MVCFELLLRLVKTYIKFYINFSNLHFYSLDQLIKVIKIYNFNEVCSHLDFFIINFYSLHLILCPFNFLIDFFLFFSKSASN